MSKISDDANRPTNTGQDAPRKRRTAGSAWRRTMIGRATVLALTVCSSVAAAASMRIEIGWPTPHTAWSEGRPASEFLQHAGSGDPESGGFGGVRSGGTQFHEGIDIKPTKRDRRGEPVDSVFAAMDGVVRHISRVAGNSSYGRYVVLEHPENDVPIYTLYAHLAKVAAGLKVGDAVTRGQNLGVMGHTAGGYVIPRERAHLHFEIGLMVTRSFQSWYDGRKFGSRNEHGLWNGMNLLGIDPLDFLNRWRAGEVDSFAGYFAQLKPTVRVRLATSRVPDFVTRYPALLRRPLPPVVAGWEIDFNETGVPFAWRPLGAAEVTGLALNRPSIVEVDRMLERRDRSRTLAVERRGQWVVARDLDTVLQQLFGLR